MKHLYTVTYEVLWATKGRSPFWGGEETMSVIANGDARKAVSAVERKAKKLTLDERLQFDDDRQEYGRLWKLQNFRLLAVQRGAEVTT
jgi:hypothetical protein